MPPSDTPSHSDRVQQTISQIENDNKNHDTGSHRLQAEVSQLRKEDMCNGKLDKGQFRTDLSQVNNQLHVDGVLPHLDIVEAGNGNAAFRGISEPGKSPTGDSSLTTKLHGTTFTYDDSGHVQSYSKHGDTWTYSAHDGEYHESINGKATKNASDNVVAVNGNNREEITHPDGSTTTIASWGGTIDRNSQGQMTKEVRGSDVKTFEYSGDTLTSMTDHEKGKPEQTYTKASDGKFYSSTDTDHKKPLDISVEPDKNSDGTTKQNGIVEIVDKNGNITDQHWGGTDVHWDKDHKLNQIDYSNGNKATDFKYGAQPDSQDPSALPDLTGFKITDKKGQTHTYTSADGSISVDGKPPVKGTLNTDANGTLTATETGDGSDGQYKSTKFGLGGSEVESGKFGNKILPDHIVNWNGKESNFKYDASGNLTSVETPYGINLHKSGNDWVDGSGQKVDVTPVIDQKGNFSVVKPDGSFETWSADGTKIDGIPDTPDAIAKESQAAQEADPQADSASNPKSGKFNPSGQDVFYQGNMTIDLDGKGTATGGDNQNSTSYADGKLSAWQTNYVALAPGWAQSHNLQLGDVVAVRHDGKTAYAIYGDNYQGDAVHTEGSIHLARTLNPGNPTDSTLSNVQFYALPGSGKDLNGSTDQADINRVGEQLFA